MNACHFCYVVSHINPLVNLTLLEAFLVLNMQKINKHHRNENRLRLSVHNSLWPEIQPLSLLFGETLRQAEEWGGFKCSAWLLVG